MMASVYNHSPRTPRQAARRKSPLDDLLDPELFKALGEPTRAGILACLIKCNRPCSVTEVAECCSIDFSVVSRHLRAMADAGVLSSDKRGRTVWYRANAHELAERFAALSETIETCRNTPCGC